MTTTLHIATWGDDIAGDASPGNPFASVARARQEIAPCLTDSWVIQAEPGTYPECIDLRGFVSAGASSIRVRGNPADPASVRFTVPATDSVHGQTFSSLALLRGAMAGALEGLTLAGTATAGVWAHSGAELTLEHVRTEGALSMALAAWYDARLFMRGALSIGGWSVAGLQLARHCYAGFAGPSTFAVQGPGSSGMGVNVADHSSLIHLSFEPGPVDVTVDGAQFGFYVDFNSSVSIQPAVGTIRISNPVSVPGSVAVHGNDHANWSTNRPLTVERFPIGFRAWATSFLEAVGPKTWNAVPTKSQIDAPTSRVYLP